MSNPNKATGEIQMSRRMAFWLIAPTYTLLAATAIMVLIHHLTGLPIG